MVDAERSRVFFIDADNAFGSPSGAVDDAYAIPLSDLIPALYALDTDGFTMEDTTATMRANTLMAFGNGTRRVRVCTRLDGPKLWDRFLRIVNGASR